MLCCRHCIAYYQHLVAVCSKYLVSAFVIGITKTHNLCFQESEALQAVFASHLSPNVLKAPARLAAQYSVINLKNLNFLFHPTNETSGLLYHFNANKILVILIHRN